MFIRFITNEIDSDSQKRIGIFQVIGNLRDNNELTDYELKRAKTFSKWFSKHLDKPKKFTKAKSSNAQNKAISWFKDSANEHINMMFEIKQIIEDHGIIVEIIKTNNPGYIVYEDEFQVTAEPFNNTVA